MPCDACLSGAATDPTPAPLRRLDPRYLVPQPSNSVGLSTTLCVPPDVGARVYAVQLNGTLLRTAIETGRFSR